MRTLRPWEQRLVVADHDWVGLAATADELQVGSVRVTNWVNTERLSRAYNSVGEVGVKRASLDGLHAFRREAGLLRKTMFALGTAVRLMWA